jgi:cobalamin biosynthesis protein CobD/CbiB
VGLSHAALPDLRLGRARIDDALNWIPARRRRGELCAARRHGRRTALLARRRATGTAPTRGP